MSQEEVEVLGGGRCLRRGSEGGRRGSREGARGSNPTRHGVMVEETCTDRALPAKASGSFWLPLSSLSLVQGALPAQWVTRG